MSILAARISDGDELVASSPRPVGSVAPMSPGCTTRAYAGGRTRRQTSGTPASAHQRERCGCRGTRSVGAYKSSREYRRFSAGHHVGSHQGRSPSGGAIDAGSRIAGLRLRAGSPQEHHAGRMIPHLAGYASLSLRMVGPRSRHAVEVACVVGMRLRRVAFPVLMTVFALATSAQAAVTLDQVPTPGPIVCVSSAQCVILGVGEDESPEFLATFDPATPATPPTVVEGFLGYRSPSCPSSAQCTAISGVGSVITFDPAVPGTAQSISIYSAYANGLTALSCPSVAQCTAVDSEGGETTFNPNSPATATHATVDTVRFSDNLLAVSCPTSMQCTAVSFNGHEVTFDPQNPSQAANFTVDADSGLYNVACPSPTRCVAVGPAGPTGHDEVTFNPEQPRHAIRATIDTRRVSRDGYFGISCPAVTQCTVVDNYGYQVTFNPATPRVFRRTRVDTTGSGDVACPAVTECVSVDTRGRLTIFRP
jgi:hypothetical protein